MALKLSHVTTYRHASVLLNDISLEVKRGEAVVIIGPNGSGKSALLATIGGQGAFDGEIKINHFSLNREPVKAKLQLGFLPNPVRLETHLTGQEWLEIVGSIYNLSPASRLPKILDLANQLGCHHDLYTTIERVGQSTIQKIGLIGTLLAEPAILVWDEPVLHLDPNAQEQLATLTNEALKHGQSVIFATNNLAWAETVADRVVVLDDGKVIAEGTVTQLHNQTKTGRKDLTSIYDHLINKP